MKKYGNMSGRIGAALALLSLCGSPTWGQGYVIRGNQIAVESRHLETWNFPVGTVEWDRSAGMARPHFVAKDIDATQDLVQHLRRNPPKGVEAAAVDLMDAVRAGSNAAGVANLLDGDPTTYWQPATSQPLRDWWFELDLGRVVTATRILLTFVDEDLGDPFLQYTLLTSDGDLPDQGLKEVKRYVVAYASPGANKNQRVFDIELKPSGEAPDPHWRGDQIRFVQLVVTESDSVRGAEISREEYEALGPTRQGTVDYYKKVADGSIRVEPELYEATDPALRGEVRYFRRERPRLAEMEVRTIGENIALGMTDRGGGAKKIELDTTAVTNMVDGLFETTVIATVKEPAQRSFFFDLGSFFWVDRVQMYFHNASNLKPFAQYEIKTSDGGLTPEGTLAWTSRGLGGGDRMEFHANVFEAAVARYISIPYGSPGERNSDTREMQFYGEGYQPRVWLTSPLITLDGAQTLSSVEWEGDTPPGTSIALRSRTGNQLADILRYFKADGTEISENAYNKLNKFAKKEIDIATEQIPGSDWSDWSEDYELSGSPITSPSPRAHLMLQAWLTTSDPYQAASLRSIRLNFLDPLARQVRGELDPALIPELGVIDTLSLFIKARFLQNGPGMDQIRLYSPGVNLDLQLMRLGQASQWATGPVTELAPIDLEQVATGPDSLWVRLDSAVGPEVDLIEVRFTTTLFRPGAILQAELGNSSGANRWQRVDPGDATDLASSQGMLLRGPVEDWRVMGPLTVSTPILTPNGDGVNDETRFEFSVFRLTGQRAVKTRLYDLNGDLVRLWEEERPLASGSYAVRWSGRDQSDQLVPPGIYLLVIEVDADAAIPNRTAHRVIHVAY